MKKIISLALFFLFACLLGCSSDSSTEQSNGTLFVNNNPFAVGTNTPPGDIHNSTLFTQGDPTDPFDQNVRTFTIVDTVTMETITLSILYPASTSTINGTYIVNETNPGTNLSYGICTYDILGGTNGHFGGQPAFASGSVTVTDFGSNNFKLVFSNVLLKENTTPAITKTITGYCETNFYQF